MLKLIERPNLRSYSTMAVDSVADCLIEWQTVDDILRLFSDPAFVAVATRPIIAVGSGSNMLFVSNPLHATLLKCTWSAIETLASDSAKDVLLKVSAGTILDDFVAYTVARGLWGAENLSKIPGTVGAAAVQNPGAYGCEFGDLVREVECYDIVEHRIVTFERATLNYAYRSSALKCNDMKGRMIVISVTVLLSTEAMPVLSYGRLSEHAAQVGDCLTSADMRRIVSDIRESKLPDPTSVPSCGSFFMNPVVNADVYASVISKAAEKGIDSGEIPAYPQTLPDGSVAYKLSAAWLIDRSGWKGIRRGNVVLWPQQPLVIVNPDGNATGREVADFAAEISADVAAKWGVTLRPEVEYL